MNLKYKGAWNSGTSYEVGDVVVYTDGVVYHLQRPTLTGSTPHDTRCWGRLQAPLAACVLMFHDLFVTLTSAAADTAATKAVVDSMLFDSKTIMLESSTADSDKVFAITVDDDGDVSATEVTDEEEVEDGEPGEPVEEGGES